MDLITVQASAGMTFKSLGTGMEIPFPKFGNGKGIKNPFPILGTGIRGFHPQEWTGTGIPAHPCYSS